MLDHEPANPYVARLERLGSGVRLPEFARALAGAQPSDDELVADAIMVYAEALRARGEPVSLTDLRRVIPWLHEAPVALGAAVDEVVASGRDRNRSLAQIASELAEQHPAVMVAIREAVLLRSELERSLADSTSATGPAFRTLPTEVGDRLGDDRCRYELRAVIGHGSQGVVYAAVDRLFSEARAPSMVAVKVFTKDRARHLGGHEAILVRRINHPGVVRVLDRGEAKDGDEFAVFELVDGAPLDQWAHEHSDELALRDRVAIVADIADAVAAAHSLGVLHRDIKPSNILIDRSGTPRVTDFGVACVPAVPLDERGKYTARGSLAFMSPEQFYGEAEAETPAADVYGLGGVLYWLLTRCYPNGANLRDAVTRLGGRADPNIAALSMYPRTLQCVAARALAPRAADRYGSAAAFAADLRAWLEHRPVEWTKPGVGQRLRLSARRSPRATLLIVGLLAMLVAVTWTSATWIATSRDKLRIAEEEAARAEVQRQLEIQNERLERSDSRARAVRQVMERWTRTFGELEITDPADYLTSLVLFQISGMADEHLTDLFRSRSADAALRGLSKAEAEGSGELAVTLWRVLAGLALLREGRRDEAVPHLVNAREELVTWVGVDDPVIKAIDARLSETDPN